jgi:hypothetical protein
MIWAILAILGVPLWLIAIFLFVLLRSRSKVNKIPQSFPCKARAASGGVSGLTDSFPRYKARGHWVHDVLILHGGNPFLIQTMPHGVAGLVHGPDAAGPTIKHLKRIKDPVSLRYRTDSGDVIEVVCAKDDLPRGLGPFSAPAASPPITTG